jgi:hypothetical protein
VSYHWIASMNDQPSAICRAARATGKRLAQRAAGVRDREVQDVDLSEEVVGGDHKADAKSTVFLVNEPQHLARQARVNACSLWRYAACMMIHARRAPGYLAVTAQGETRIHYQ